MKRKQSDTSPNNKKQKTNVSNSVLKTNHEIKRLNDSSIINILSFLTNEEVFQNTALVCKKFEDLCYAAIKSFFLTSDAISHSSSDKLLNLIQKLSNVQSVFIDGFDSSEDNSDDSASAKLDTILPLLLDQAKVSNPHLTELHISQCEIYQPLKIVNDKQLKVLKLDNMVLHKGLILECSSLQSLELYNCEIVTDNATIATTNSRIELSKCYNLETLKFFKCNLTDKLLHTFLKNFFSPHMIKRVDQYIAQKNQTTKVQQTPPSDEPSPYKLSRLHISECELLTNPVIQSETMEDLRMINCNKLQNPFISCGNLKRLQLNWCEELENVTMSTNTLQKMDLTGAGKKNNKDNTRQHIVSAVKQFNENIEILY